MAKILNHTIEVSSLFTDKRFIFLGESIHGVSEFAHMRLEIAKCYFDNRSILVFEADGKGMLLSHQRNDDAVSRLNHFPGVLRTQEMLNLLTWAVSMNIPCLGIDCIPRCNVAIFPRDSHRQRLQEIADYNTAKQGNNYFEWRDAKMAENLSNIAASYPDHRMLIILHNLHIKRSGTQENARLKVKSVREHFEELFPQQSSSIAQIARSGEALHNDLSPFNFQIRDPLSLETFPDAAECTLLTTETIPANKVAWHHAFERETVPVKKQYEGCFIFNHVHAPILV